MAFVFGMMATLATLLGGLFALRFRDNLHLILGFSAGAVVGVAFFDLLPEFSGLAGPSSAGRVCLFVAGGFLAFMLLSRMVLLHPHSDECENERHQGGLGAASLSLHSFLDGLGIGLAFQASAAAGLVVAIAVIAHDFSDGINTVGFVLKHAGKEGQARLWLAVDAAAPLIGVACARLLHLQDAALGLVLAVFCGFFLYIGASDLVPESHHRHPTLATSLTTILGAAVIYAAVHFAGM